VRGIPIWATLVGLEYKGEQIAGIAYLPAMGDTYRALCGDGAYRGERRIHVSGISKLSDAMMFYSSISWFEKAGRRDTFLQLAVKTQRQRGFGDFYGFVLVAQGSGEVMMEHGVHVWDVVGLKAIIEEAGGRFTDWEGNPTVDRPDVLATNGVLHDEILRLLKRP
jgi:histidinol-phosphatase